MGWIYVELYVQLDLCPFGLTTYHLLFIYLYILLIAIWITVHVESMSSCMSTCLVISMSIWVNYVPTNILLWIYIYNNDFYLDNSSCGIYVKMYVHFVPYTACTVYWMYCIAICMHICIWIAVCPLVLNVRPHAHVCT